MTESLVAARLSIKPTYDHRETGDRYVIETRLNGNVVSVTPTRDPFITHTLTVGRRDLIRCLWRRKAVVQVIVSADRELVEDVCELDADYTGRHDSSRRAEWRKQIEEALRG